MNLLYCFIFSVGFLLCMTVCLCRGVTVTGFLGQNVVLPCTYDSQYHGKCEICWMRDNIPASGCGNEIIATNGDKVERRTSSRYMLNGDIQSGNVSLTIINVTQNDAGKYGCRVHVPGLFNDEKNVVYLVLVEAETVTTAPVISSITVNVTDKPWLSLSTTQVISTNLSNISLPVENKNVNDMTYDVLPAILVSILLLLIGALAVYMIWKQKTKRRVTLETSQNMIIYSNLNSSAVLQNRHMVVENVYQLDNENEYERWS